MIVIAVVFIGILSFMYMRFACTGVYSKALAMYLDETGKKFEKMECHYVGWKNFMFFKSTHNSPNTGEIEVETVAAQYESINPHFKFNYPNLEGYIVTVGSSSIEYHVSSSDLEGPVGAVFGWEEVSMEVPSNYWDQQNVNSKGVHYATSIDENVLDFYLKNQEKIIRFDVRLPGGYVRKKHIIETIVDSFEETINLQ